MVNLYENDRQPISLSHKKIVVKVMSLSMVVEELLVLFLLFF